jgi:hypothetical protein
MSSILVSAFIGMLYAPFVLGQCSCGDIGRIAISNIVIADHVYDLPRVVVKATQQLSDLPTVIELTINTTGSVCSVQVTTTPVPVLIRGVEESIRKWTFHPVFQGEGKTRRPTCVSSKLFLYTARNGRRLVWDVPGITDRDKHK